MPLPFALSAANSWLELAEACLFVFGACAAWWHLDCDHPGCLRLPGSGRYCHKHKHKEGA